MFRTSGGAHYLGIPLIFEYFNQVIDHYPNKPILSIGSGNGCVEHLIDKQFDTDIICIDPDPLSYNENTIIYKEPKYGTIEDVNFPLNEYKNNCIVFVSWSYPEDTNGYDIIAIHRLNPICIIVITETGEHRGAGSIGLHNFLLSNNVPTKGYYIPNVDNCPRPRKLVMNSYNLCATTYCIHEYEKNKKVKFEIIALSIGPITFYVPHNITYNTINKTNMWTEIKDKWQKALEKLNEV